MTLVAVAAIIVAVWAALLGTAFAARASGAGAGAGIAAVSIVYLALATAALLRLGPGRSGWLGAAGMLVPWLTATVLAVRVRPQDRR